VARRARLRTSTKEVIEWRPIGSLLPYDKNARRHPPEQIEAIRRSFQKFGWVHPILISEDGGIIAGHARLEVAIAEGWTDAKCLVATGMSKAEVRAFIIADNQLALGGEWDPALLKAELLQLERADFDLGTVGFSGDELERLLHGLVVDDPAREWAGMPDFTQEDKESFRTIHVHFADQAGVDDFARRIDRPITDKTRFIWHPEAAEESYVDKRYLAVGGEAEETFRYFLPEGFDLPKAFKWILDKDLKKNPFDRVVVRPGDAVMDCGAAVGTFSASALEAGAGKVYCYEPHPKSVEVLRRNVERYGKRAVVIEGALVPDDRVMAKLEAGSAFPGNHSIVSRAKVIKDSFEVGALNFRGELTGIRPQVVKIDIEGGEYGLLGSLEAGDLESVRCLFVEFHPIDNREERIAAIRAYIEAEGLEVVKTRLRAFTALRR
jgi:FkbM family methyltransferase